MIKRARIRFICITMSILFVVFAVIFGAFYYISFTVNEYQIERTLNDTANDFYLSDQEVFVHSNSIIAVVHSPTLSGYSYEFWYDANTFTKERAESIIQSSIKNIYTSGKIGNVYYKIIKHDFNTDIFVATDATQITANFRTNVLNVLFILSQTFLVLLIVVAALSASVFKPIKETLDKQKQFISNASHELKTPIAIISANADVLQAENDTQWASNIKSQTVRMSGLVEDMLSLAKIDEGKVKLKFEKFNISDEITKSALPFDALAFEKHKTLNLFIQPDLFYTGDKQSVKQIVNILIDNAVKHASDNGEIMVELKKENGKIKLAVSNTGSSIPVNSANKIFERFYRGDQSRSRDSGGSGLGLSIAKGLADTNKWKISAVSIPDVSMTITVLF